MFQKTVIDKYLKAQKQEQINQQWNMFKTYFGNAEIQENIRNAKEEQFQEGFLRELFVKILGYTLNPEPNFNLTTEYKNVKDSKKADGGIIVGNKVKAVIELKGTNTTDLSKIEAQAFGYKNNQEGCTYVITSNFEKLRLYIDNAIEHIEFNLFTLTIDSFKLLYLCLAFENLSKDIPKKIKDDSLSQEDIITKRLYKDYSVFKRELFANLSRLNPQYDVLVLFKKSQKLLDRFLFLFFAEDRQLLPPNSVRLILNDWNDLQERDVDIPLYQRFKKYFEYLNIGYKGKRYDVFAYNGGLFKPDEILDAIKIDDQLLYNHTLKLSEYDFNSEVDVNILGHIFENSLNEIEEIQAELEGQEVDKSKTKRKKDGVFYTPKYITKYIVENTVGKLCEEKRAELDITDEAYQATTKRSRKKLENLQLYREWLLQLTICDPACGSGAFLNEALNFLIAEHRYIDELSAKYNKDAFVLSDVEKSILENNLYGVDLNEESVEIAKLSLWLRTAQRNRKLNDLNNNLKCGNSLIDNPDIAGNKAFNWQKEFPKVFSPVDLQAFHVVLTTHNSRTSQRMIDYNVKKGPPLELKLKEEIALTQYIGEVIKEKGYCCMAYNICKDHVHLILVCEEEQLAEQVKTIKGKSSYLFQSNGFKPIGESLWSQKFFAADLDVWKLWTADNAKGYGANDQYIDRAIHYINHNREKHQLPESKELEKIIAGFVKNKEKSFSPQYKGGFDVIIGNPPYVQADDTLYNNYQTQKCGDLYAYFFERGLNIITQKGILGYITPSSFFTNIGFAPLREYLIQYDINVLIDLGENVFTDASVDSGITIITYYKTKESIIEVSDSSFNFSQIKKSIFKRLNENMFNIYINPIKFDLANSIEAGLCFDDFIEFSRGVEFGFNSDNVINERIEGYFPIICGGNLLRNQINFEGKYVNYDKNNLKIYKSKKIYEEEKILVRRIGNTIISSYDDNKYYNVCDVYNLQLKNQFKDVISLKYIAMFLNSKLIEFYFSVKFKSVKKLFPKIPIK
ncbi:MAG: TaqI-like C-terminal specificity domain-containing protein [Chitinophagales bacterium]